MGAPLSGIRVLDLTRVLAGPWCTQLLGDLGAEIIKVENPAGGDETRHWGPPWVKDRDGYETEHAAYFFSANRNKQSITLNLRSPQGIRIVKELVAESDIVVENFKVGDMAKRGLDYDSLRALRPQLIYLSITGFGQTGPMANQPGYDYMIQGLGGLMSITGEADDQPGGGPQRVGVAIADINTGFYATIAILSALLERQQTGVGQYIDLALLDCQVGWLANQAMNYLIGGEVPARSGNAHPNLVPYQPFWTSDGAVIVAVGNDRQYRLLCAELGRDDLAQDARFATNAKRVANRQTLVAEIQHEMKQKPSEFWISALPVAGVPCSLIHDMAQVFDFPQIRARRMQRELPHAVAGTVPTVANPIRFSRSQIDYRNAPPLLGEHTESVLAKILGYTASEIQALRDAGAI